MALEAVYVEVVLFVDLAVFFAGGFAAMYA